MRRRRGRSGVRAGRRSAMRQRLVATAISVRERPLDPRPLDRPRPARGVSRADHDRAFPGRFRVHQHAAGHGRCERSPDQIRSAFPRLVVDLSSRSLGRQTSLIAREFYSPLPRRRPADADEFAAFATRRRDDRPLGSAAAGRRPVPLLPDPERAPPRQLKSPPNRPRIDPWLPPTSASPLPLSPGRDVRHPSPTRGRSRSTTVILSSKRPRACS